MVLINRLAVILVMAGALFFVARQGGHDSVTTDPQALWNNGVEGVNGMVSEDAQTTVQGPFKDSMSYAETFGDDVRDIAD